jgi:membrane-associated phospholipid phosphatase
MNLLQINWILLSERINRMGKWILFLGLYITAFTSQAAGNDTIQYPELNKIYIKSYWHDSKSFVISPAKWRTKQWIEFGVVAGAGVLAYTQDEKIQKYFTNHQSETADNFSKYVFEPFGRFAPVIIGGLYIGGRLVKDNRLAGTSLTAAKAFVVSSVCAGIVKQLTHRHRPYQGDIPDHANWDGPFASYKYNSFPSGHSEAAFSMATVYAMEYSSTIWVPVLAFTLAAGTAVSRLYDNDHWASDVVIGSALGFVTGRFMWKQSKKGNNKLVVLPSAGTHSATLTCLIRLGDRK